MKCKNIREFYMFIRTKGRTVESNFFDTIEIRVHQSNVIDLDRFAVADRRQKDLP